MLSEIMEAGVPTKKDSIKPGATSGLYISGFYPCAYRMYRIHLGDFYPKENTPQGILIMEDGSYEEAQAKERLLKYAKVEIVDSQMRVTVGKSETSGRIDGRFTLKERMLWEFKAMNYFRYSNFCSYGLEYFPDYKCQVHAYLNGTGDNKCCFQAKDKDSNAYHDEVIEYDEKFILPIIEMVDEIKLGNWEPKPELCDLCSKCGFGCFGTILDFSGFLSYSDKKSEEMALKWVQGDKMEKVGDMYKQEARTYFTGQVLERGKQVKKFPGLIGDEESLVSSGLVIKRGVQNRVTVEKAAVLENFGPEGLAKVLSTNKIITYTIKEA